MRHRWDQRLRRVVLLFIAVAAGTAIACVSPLPVFASTASPGAGLAHRPAWLRCRPGVPGSG